MFTFGWFDRLTQSTVPAFGTDGCAPGASRRWSASGKKWDLGAAPPAAAPVDPTRATITVNDAIAADAFDNLRVPNLDLPLSWHRPDRGSSGDRNWGPPPVSSPQARKEGSRA